MKIYYTWDAFCAWCYGFNSIFVKFHKNHPELDIEIISGGLCVGEDSKKIGEYGFFEKGNKKISEIYGVEFGKKYYDLIEEGNTVLDSNVPATVFSILKERVEKKRISELAFEIQKLYFIEGKSLSDVKSYSKLGEEFGFEFLDIEIRINKALKNTDLAMKDYKKAMEMNIQIFPTVIVEKNGKYYDFIKTKATLQELENALQKVMEL